MKSTGAVVFLLAFFAVLYAVLAPVFLHATHHCQYPNCESNLKQIGTAIKMYLPDWDDHYPINCAWNAKHKAGPMVSHVKLAPVRSGANGSGPALEYGPNWVEALYRYTEQIGDLADEMSLWRCQDLGKETSSRDSDTAAVSYAFNENLVAATEGEIRGPDHLMMVREMDRLGNAELRPMNRSTQNPNASPISPFLTHSDREMGLTKSDLHRRQADLPCGGSHILFGDGHVRLFSADFFPSDRFITRHECWEPKTKQWFNYGPGSIGHVKAAMVESIAITQ